jgi:hypothetical protein
VVIYGSVLLIFFTINISDNISIENQNTQFIFNDFLKIMPSWENVRKYGMARQITKDNAIFGQVTRQSQKYISIYIN